MAHSIFGGVLNMAELCVKCFQQECEELDEPFTKRGYIISKDADLCETCGEWKPVVVRRKKLYFLYQLAAPRKNKNRT